jgi:hypothetical protein
MQYEANWAGGVAAAEPCDADEQPLEAAATTATTDKDANARARRDMAGSE